MAGKRGFTRRLHLLYFQRLSSTVNLSFVLESLYGNIDKFKVLPLACLQLSEKVDVLQRVIIVSDCQTDDFKRAHMIRFKTFSVA